MDCRPSQPEGAPMSWDRPRAASDRPCAASDRPRGRATPREGRSAGVVPPRLAAARPNEWSLGPAREARLACNWHRRPQSCSLMSARMSQLLNWGVAHNARSADGGADASPPPTDTIARGMRPRALLPRLVRRLRRPASDRTTPSYFLLGRIVAEWLDCARQGWEVHRVA